MNCPNCQASNSKVIETRHSEDYTRRRRECLECSNRWTTCEIDLGTYDRLRWIEKRYCELRLMVEDLL